MYLNNYYFNNLILLAYCELFTPKIVIIRL